MYFGNGQKTTNSGLSGTKKDFPEELGLFQDLFWSRSGPLVAICTKMQIA